MQMDKRNQIGCEDMTKLSEKGVRFDPRAERKEQTGTIESLETARLPVDRAFAALKVPEPTQRPN